MNGRVTLVTGGGRGIGREAALLLSAAGARVMVVSRSATELAAVGLEYVTADLGTTEGCALAVAETARRLGPIDVTSQSSTQFTYPGTFPVVSANGTANAIVWAYENTSTAVLHAYAATNLATELYNSNQASNGRDQFGVGNKYIAPVVADGKVFVATTNSVAVFGLLPRPHGIIPRREGWGIADLLLR